MAETRSDPTLAGQVRWLAASPKATALTPAVLAAPAAPTVGHTLAAPKASREGQRRSPRSFAGCWVRAPSDPPQHVRLWPYAMASGAWHVMLRTCGIGCSGTVGRLRL